jgi:hypothetical protein
MSSKIGSESEVKKEKLLAQKLYILNDKKSN